jgi:hypothetical protein
LILAPFKSKKITEASTYMHRRRLQIGSSIVDTEMKLDSLFKHNNMNDGNLIFYTGRYGAYRGELMNAMLYACLSTQKLLSQQQMAKYESLQKRN